MQWMAAAFIGFYVLVLCINGAFYWITTELINAGVLEANNPLTGRNDLFEQQGAIANSTLQGLNSGNAFNPVLIFGDFIGGGLNPVFNMISGGYVLSMLNFMHFPSSFIFMLQVVVIGTLGVGVAIYYLSGRQ